MQTTGEQLAFIRFIQELRELDLVPLGAPDGKPDLDLVCRSPTTGSARARTRASIRRLRTRSCGRRLVAGGARRAESCSSKTSSTPVEWALRSWARYRFSPRPAPDGPMDRPRALPTRRRSGRPAEPRIVHVCQSDRSRRDVEEAERPGSRRDSDQLVPNNATRSLVYALGATPLIEPVAEPVPYLTRAEAPLTGNVDAQTTSAYAQYVPNGVPGLPPTPGCEFWTNGHYCPQTAPAALDQRFRFFETALYDEAPTIYVGQTPSTCAALRPTVTTETLVPRITAIRTTEAASARLQAALPVRSTDKTASATGGHARSSRCAA